MSRILLCSSCVQERRNRVRSLSRRAVKAHVLSLQSRGRRPVTGTMGHAAYSLTRWSRYGESGLHAADRCSTMKQCTGVGGLDMPRGHDGSSQRPRRGHSAAYASTNVSPNLCPGFPYIRSTRGSFYTDRSDHASPDSERCSVEH